MLQLPDYALCWGAAVWFVITCREDASSLERTADGLTRVLALKQLEVPPVEEILQDLPGPGKLAYPGLLAQVRVLLSDHEMTGVEPCTSTTF